MMTPKEKAKQLYQSYYNKYGYYGIPSDAVKNTKDMCYICIEQIFDFIQADDEYNGDCHMANTHWPRYWVDVKNEIKDL